MLTNRYYICVSIIYKKTHQFQFMCENFSVSPSFKKIVLVDTVGRGRVFIDVSIIISEGDLMLY